MIDRESVKVSNMISKDSIVQRNQRHLDLKTFSSSQNQCEEDLLVNELNVGVELSFKNGGKKRNFNAQKTILSPKLGVRMKRPQTPKGRNSSDLCPPNRFRSVRAMFLKLEEGEKLVEAGPQKSQKLEKIGELDRLKPNSDNCIKENVALNSLNRTLMVPKSPLKKGEIVCPNSLMQDNLKIGPYLSQKLGKI